MHQNPVQKRAVSHAVFPGQQTSVLARLSGFIVNKLLWDVIFSRFASSICSDGNTPKNWQEAAAKKGGTEGEIYVRTRP